MLEQQFEYIRSITDFSPEILIILGSGLGDICDGIEDRIEIEYGDIPSLPVSTAPKHEGKFIFGTLSGRRVAIMQGRVHLYEGYTPQEAVNHIRLIRLLGAKYLVITNAAGGINIGFRPGDLMMIDDHISLFVPSPLVGKNDDKLGTRFPDMSEVYSKRLRKIISDCADDIGVKLQNGVYVQLTGPAFETPAEIRALASLGADAVGMSSVIEAEAAKHCGYEVCGISLISNLACGISKTPITAEEVHEAGEKITPVLSRLIINSIGKF